MAVRMWTYDLAREQTPTLDFLEHLASVTRDSGYAALGIYMEHRYAYACAPWASGRGSIDAETVRHLQSSFPDLQVVPFVNLLGHMEGFLGTEGGKRFGETGFGGMQACPCNESFQEFCRQMLLDILDTFSSNLVHLGGDETKDIGTCETCSQATKAELYGRHFGPLAKQVLDAGKRPALWADMLLQHPEAAEWLPKETLLFNWQYFDEFESTIGALAGMGFEVVACPTLHTYNAAWMHLGQSEANLRDALDARSAGVCLTTWEQSLFGNYKTLLPAVEAAGRILSGEGATLLGGYRALSERHEHWAHLMGVELPKIGGPFAFSKTRSSLRVRMLLHANPFLAWQHHQELAGELGDQAIPLLQQAAEIAPDSNYRGVSEFCSQSIEFIRYTDQARQAYAQGLPGLAISSLAPCRQIVENMERIAIANQLNAGGSRADIERCRVAREHVERVIRRIKEYGDGVLGYLPAFEHITHPKFIPHDQGAWWKVNAWAAA